MSNTKRHPIIGMIFLLALIFMGLASCNHDTSLNRALEEVGVYPPLEELDETADDCIYQFYGDLRGALFIEPEDQTEPVAQDVELDDNHDLIIYVYYYNWSEYYGEKEREMILNTLSSIVTDGKETLGEKYFSGRGKIVDHENRDNVIDTF